MTIASHFNSIHNGDCITGMQALTAGCVDLVFADPPFNIGYEYDVYNDKLGREKYLKWSRDWIAAVHRVLKANGTFWLAIGDEYAAELKILSQEIGFHTRSWVVWYYTFGVNCKNKFTRSHAHLFYFVKDPNQFTFRSEDLENRIPSARELVYNDKRANPRGRLPDDTWIIRPAEVVGELMGEDGTWSPSAVQPKPDDTRTWTLRPQDIENCFQASEDTWYIPRVAGTFKERQGFHGCQMPEQLLGRIIRSCSSEGDCVLDPFSGSATTLAVAKKLNRKYIGFELSTDYVEYGRQRLRQIRIGDRLDGSAEPTKSAPKTGEDIRLFNGKKLSKPQRDLFADEGRIAERQLELTVNGVAEAFRICHAGFSIERVVIDPDANALFHDACRQLGLAGEPRTWNTFLFRLRQAGQLVHVEVTRKTDFTWTEIDPYFYASEIALQSLLDDERAESLDEIFCDPLLALEFDLRAALYAPAQRALEFRWAAFMLTQQTGLARRRGKILVPPAVIGKPVPLNELDLKQVTPSSGVYLLRHPDNTTLYAGETLNLQRRLSSLINSAEPRSRFGDSLHVQVFPTQTEPEEMLAWQSCFITRYKPLLNYQQLAVMSPTSKS